MAKHLFKKDGESVEKFYAFKDAITMVNMCDGLNTCTEDFTSIQNCLDSCYDTGTFLDNFTRKYCEV